MAKDKGFGKKWKKEQERLGTFTPLPKDDYPSVVKSATIENNKSGDGRNLVMEHKIFKGKQKGKILKNWLAFENDNEETEDIAAKHIASMCDATGIELEKFKDPKMIVGKKMIIGVVVTPGDGKYGPGNDIKSYSDISGKKKKDKKRKKPF